MENIKEYIKEKREKIKEKAMGISKKTKAVMAFMLFASVFATAAYVVGTISVPVTVTEAFSVGYSLADSNGACYPYNYAQYTSATPSITGYPGDTETICVSITNNGNGNLPFAVTNDNPSVLSISYLGQCSGTISAHSGTVCAIVNTIKADAAPVSGVTENISVTRG